MNTDYRHVGAPIGISDAHKICRNFDVYLFIMVKSMQGSTDVTTDPAYVGLQSSYDIPSTTYTTYGFDIMETTSGVTVSGLINMAGEKKILRDTIATYLG